MSQINTITIEGKAVSDIVLRKSNAGISVVDFRLIHKNKKARNPVFIDVEIWGVEAEKLAASASHGSYMIIYGELRRDVWEREGQERSKIKITANKVVVADRTENNETPSGFEPNQ